MGCCHHFVFQILGRVPHFVYSCLSPGGTVNLFSPSFEVSMLGNHVFCYPPSRALQMFKETVALTGVRVLMYVFCCIPPSPVISWCLYLWWYPKMHYTKMKLLLAAWSIWASNPNFQTLVSNILIVLDPDSILKCLFVPLLLLYVAWPGLSPNPEKLLIRPVWLLVERHVEPGKGFLLKVRSWMLFNASPGRLPALTALATCDVPAKPPACQQWG